MKFMQKMEIRQTFVSQRVRTYQQLYLRQVQLNSYFHSYAKQYEDVYMGPNTAEHQIQSPVTELCKSVSTFMHLSEIDWLRCEYC